MMACLDPGWLPLQGQKAEGKACLASFPSGLELTYLLRSSAGRVGAYRHAIRRWFRQYLRQDPCAISKDPGHRAHRDPAKFEGLFFVMPWLPWSIKLRIDAVLRKEYVDRFIVQTTELLVRQGPKPSTSYEGTYWHSRWIDMDLRRQNQ
jgi:hypothetical protein